MGGTQGVIEKGLKLGLRGVALVDGEEDRRDACLGDISERLDSPRCDFFWISTTCWTSTQHGVFPFIHAFYFYSTFCLPIIVHNIILLRFKYCVCFILVDNRTG